MTADIDVAVANTIDPVDLYDLYSSVGWVAYTRDRDSLAAAVANSSHVVTARIDGTLVGLARAMTDDVSIFYLQDILVRPDWQRRGVGRKLLASCLERFKHVRQKVLITDDEPAQHRFYESLGYSDTRAIANATLRTFVQIEGA